MIKKSLVFCALLFAVVLFVRLGEAQRVNGVSAPVLGATTVTTLDTGQGANELYDMDQNVLIASDVSHNSLTLGTAGVAMTQDGDGAIIWCGQGNGSDECLTLNLDDTANTANFSSTTGVLTIGFPAGFFQANRFYLDNVMFNQTAPTISSGFGTSPSITTNNGSAAFSINVGTGGTASTGVVGMPVATNGWACGIQNISTNTATVFLTKQTATTTTTVTVGNYDAAGAAAAWVASNVLVFHCIAV